MPHESTWPGIAKERQAHRDASIAAVKPAIPPVDTTTLPLNVFKTLQSLLLPPEVEITEMDPLLLLQQLATGKISAVTVTNAFLRRAAVVQKLVRIPLSFSPGITPSSTYSQYILTPYLSIDRQIVSPNSSPPSP